MRLSSLEILFANNLGSTRITSRKYLMAFSRSGSIKPVGAAIFSLNLIETPLFKNGEEENSAMMALKYAPPLIDELRKNMQEKADKKAGGKNKAGRVKHHEIEDAEL